MIWLSQNDRICGDIIHAQILCMVQIFSYLIRCQSYVDLSLWFYNSIAMGYLWPLWPHWLFPSELAPPPPAGERASAHLHNRRPIIWLWPTTGRRTTTNGQCSTSWTKKPWQFWASGWTHLLPSHSLVLLPRKWFRSHPLNSVEESFLGSWAYPIWLHQQEQLRTRISLCLFTIGSW